MLQRVTKNPSARCPVCFYKVKLRKNGSVGAHRYKVFDGYGPRLRSVVGIRQCSGAGLKPDERPGPDRGLGAFVWVAPGWSPRDWRLTP